MSKKILVVDDDKDILDIISFILSEKDYHVIQSQTADVVSYLEQIKPDLILLDNWLAGDIIGADICKIIKASALHSNIPVILISAVTGLDQMARDCKADGYIAKPFDVDQLEQMVAKLV